MILEYGSFNGKEQVLILLEKMPWGSRLTFQGNQTSKLKEKKQAPRPSPQAGQEVGTQAGTVIPASSSNDISPEQQEVKKGNSDISDLGENKDKETVVIFYSNRRKAPGLVWSHDALFGGLTRPSQESFKATKLPHLARFPFRSLLGWVRHHTTGGNWKS